MKLITETKRLSEQQISEYRSMLCSKQYNDGAHLGFEGMML